MKFVFVFYMYSLFGAPSYSPVKCRELYRVKKYQAAAKCYLELYGVVDIHKSWSRQPKLYKDRFLRHAGFCYQNAAKASVELAKKSYFFEKASKLFFRSFREGSCEATARCRLHHLHAQRLEKEVKYGFLSVSTREPKASIVVGGYRFRDRSKKSFQKKLRPGHFRIRISFVDGKEVIKKVFVPPGQSVTLDATPAQVVIKNKKIRIARKVPQAIYVSYIAGGAAGILGIGMLIGGISYQVYLNRWLLDVEQNATLSEQDFHSGFDNAEWVKILGSVLAAAGAVTILIGVLAHSQNRAKSQKLPLIEPPLEFKNKSSLHFSIQYQ